MNKEEAEKFIDSPIDWEPLARDAKFTDSKVVDAPTPWGNVRVVLYQNDNLSGLWSYVIHVPGNPLFGRDGEERWYTALVAAQGAYCEWVRNRAGLPAPPPEKPEKPPEPISSSWFLSLPR